LDGGGLIKRSSHVFGRGLCGEFRGRTARCWIRPVGPDRAGKHTHPIPHTAPKPQESASNRDGPQAAKLKSAIMPCMSCGIWVAQPIWIYAGQLEDAVLFFPRGRLRVAPGSNYAYIAYCKACGLMEQLRSIISALHGIVFQTSQTFEHHSHGRSGTVRGCDFQKFAKS
jgi:hypothetical protein